jgi:hypothetical protein
VQSLEWYVLGEGDHLEVIVNVTEILEISEVKSRLGIYWTWESTETRILPDEGEGITEWLVLNKPTRKALDQVA